MPKQVPKASSPIERRLLGWSTAHDLLIVFGAWALLLACMGVAQAMGYRLGFAVWPMGEDRNWIDILQDKDRYAAARAFWQVDDRNALAPWWYIALRRPIIFPFESGLLMIREAVGLVLAFSTYLFLFVMTRGRMFALGIACVVAVFMANGYIEQIYWIMQVALILSLCALTLYQLAIEKNPTDYRLYVTALVLWFFALGTYGVQAGGVLAIAFLAFTAPAENMLARVRRTVIDALPFASVFLGFWLSWQTTARNVYTAQFHAPETLASLAQAFWHFDYIPMYQLVVYPVAYRFIFAISAAIVGLFVLFNLGRRQEALPSGSALLRTLIAAVCLMAPVVAVEASKHGVPGEGWRKIYQFTIPFLYLSIAAAGFWLLPRKAGSVAWCISAASLAAIATAATLGINRLQVEVTRSEKILREGLLRLAKENFNAGRMPPYQFLIRRGPDVHWYASDVLSPTYAKTWKFPWATSFRFLPDRDMTDPRFALKFTEDGVENAAFDGKMTGNSHIYVVATNDEGVRRLCSLGPQEVKSPVVEWERSSTFQSTTGDCAGR